MKRTIGIIGGMGPMATSDLFRKVLEASDAHSDQEYPRVVIDCNTEIPDRTMAILHGGKNPVPEMVRSAVRLEGMGADVLIMPCNTAHYYYDQIRAYVRTPMINMLEETAKALMEKGLQKVGLLATDGTIQSGVYKKAFDRYGIDMLVPGDEDQRSVMDIIYNGVKSNNYSIDTTSFRRTMQRLEESGAQTLVLGCTELPIAFERFGFTEKSEDPTDILARSAVRFINELEKC